ncbi:MAG: hypothetical protein QE285_19480 [Aquabacterium sp.]|nr:hypothetical protein [Aquabacterium sp.]
MAKLTEAEQATREALAAAQAQGQKLAAELISRDESLKQAQTAAATAQADLAAHAEALTQAHAAHAQLTSNLSDKNLALAEVQQRAEQSLAQVAVLEGENRLQLIELHQMQGALDQRELEKRQQAADVQQAQAEQAALLASVRAEWAQQAEALGARVETLADALAAKAQALLHAQHAMAQGQTELAAHAEALSQAQAAQAQLTAALQDKGVALAAAEALAEQGRAQATTLAEENQALLHDVHQMQGALDQRELQKQQQAADAVAAKQQVQALQAQLTADLQGKAEALAAAQQLAEQGRAQAVQLEAENDLLLLQLHQAQGDLDQHASQNRQLQEVMGQSRQSLDRARRLISRLMLPAPVSGEAVPAAQAAQAA